MKYFWIKLFKSYQLSEENCKRLSHVMMALFSPITYPTFEVLNLIKYTKRKLQLNAFLENEKDLARVSIHRHLVLFVFLIKIIDIGMFAYDNPDIDLELPLSKQPKRLQTRVIDYFDAFTVYKNERTKVDYHTV